MPNVEASFNYTKAIVILDLSVRFYFFDVIAHSARYFLKLFRNPSLRLCGSTWNINNTFEIFDLHIFNEISFHIRIVSTNSVSTPIIQKAASNLIDEKGRFQYFIRVIKPRYVFDHNFYLKSKHSRFIGFSLAVNCPPELIDPWDVSKVCTKTGAGFFLFLSFHRKINNIERNVMVKNVNCY